MIQIKFCSCTVILMLGLVFSNISYAQTSYHATIVSEKNDKPIAYATVSVPQKNIAILADGSGNFNVSYRIINVSDTFNISSVGYSTYRLAVRDAQKISVIRLKEHTSDLENVTLFTNEAVEGNKLEKSGYFRSWPTKSKGGEIGKIFVTKANEFLVDRIRFKVNNQCNACQVRLRIREVVNGFPGEELFTDSISMPVKKLNFDDHYSEFDLSKKQIVLKQKSVFVSLEVLYCTGEPCSFCFIGTEPGTFMYKNKANTIWEESTSHNLYLRFYYKY